MFDPDEMMPGDQFTVNETFTYIGTDWAGNMTTEEGFDVPEHLDYEIVDQPRPEGWPPKQHDVWRIGSTNESIVHFLGEEFRDEDGDEIELNEWLSESELTASDMKLLYRVH